MHAFLIEIVQSISYFFRNNLNLTFPPRQYTFIFGKQEYSVKKMLIKTLFLVAES